MPALTVADVITGVRIRLQDRDDSNYVWPTVVLTEYVGEALRRLAPVVRHRVETLVAAPGTAAEFDLPTVVGTNFAELEDVVSDFASADWNIYGAKLIFASAPGVAFSVRSMCYYDDVGDLPGALADAVALFVCARALDYLTRRGGVALRRYLVDQGELQVAELRGLADNYRADFFQLREEWGSSSFRRF